MSLSRFFVPLVPFFLAGSLARRLLNLMGIGSGTAVSGSGEVRAMTQALKRAGRNGDAPVIFDVGANIGDWTLAALRCFPRAVVHAFEPSAHHQDIYRQAVGERANVRLAPIALGARDETASLYKDRDLTGLASLTRRDLGHLGIDMSIREEVTVRMLDTYAEEAGVAAIDYLKLDVEGHELDVLKGAGRMIAEGRIAAIQFEFGGCNIDTRTYFRDFYRLLAGVGYSIYVIRPGGSLAPILKYREFYEQFATTNYVAILDKQVGG